MSSSCQLGALWEANSAPVTLTVNWISKAEVGPVIGKVPRQLYCDSSLSESTWLWMPTQCNGQLEQPIFMCLNPTSYSQTYFREDTDSETAQGFASPCSQFSDLAAPPYPVCPRLCYHSSSFCFPSEHLRPLRTPSHLSLKATCPHKN